MPQQTARAGVQSASPWGYNPRRWCSGHYVSVTYLQVTSPSARTLQYRSQAIAHRQLNLCKALSVQSL
jgi:hypothetical protein